ncbi:hypothetical protein RJ55_07182 [Drechmeria coniospora]|nr:hypothetical protein RJ55_07182 [Drechmeria coniospora]
MSNSAVGTVYQAIIEEVINSSRVDFEESGVEEAVLEELRQGWQQKLSQLGAAAFPWDPKPEPVPPMQPVEAAQPAPAAAPLMPSPGHAQTQFSSQIPLPMVSATDGSVQNGVKQEGIKQENIKQEPGSGPGAIPPFPTYIGMENKSVAANRAAQQLQLQYGMRAAGSINAIQNLGQQGDQSQSQAAGQAASHIRNGQTDGAGDDDDSFEGVLVQRGAGGHVEELGRVEIDRMLHDQIAAKAKAMEAGGLMLPLKEVTKHRAAPAGRGNDKGVRVAAYDGGDDDDDVDDEDAINSDLDDPEDDRDDDEVDDEGLGHIMLCMYDKVQRVKNKWKCTLKDGVLTVNGKEYVFHKATGEYEW